MRKKPILLFLAPAGVFVILAVATLITAVLISPDSKDRASRMELRDLVRKVESGELHVAEATLARMVLDSRELRDEGRQTMADAFRIFGCVSVCGAVLQIYLVFRLKVGGTASTGVHQSLQGVDQ
jgi:hypothetical protein